MALLGSTTASPTRVPPIFRSPEPNATDAASARRAIDDWLVAHESTLEIRSSVVLVVSELVTNAVRHARTGFDLFASVDGLHLSVEVWDRDTRPPVVQEVDGEAIGGRGMQIVEALADDWGTQREVRNGVAGKAVWARWDLVGQQRRSGGNGAGSA